MLLRRCDGKIGLVREPGRVTLCVGRREDWSIERAVRCGKGVKETREQVGRQASGGKGGV